MKTLSIEEKARRYDEAIEKFNVIFNLNTVKESGTIFADDVRKIFPELKESDDERIRKELIAHFKTNSVSESWSGLNVKKVIAWLEKQGKSNIGISEATKQKLENNLNKALEKETPESWNKFLDEQGEQKPIDKVEPKFHEGDIMRTLEEAKEGITDGLPVVVSIDEEYYHCNNELISIKDQDKYEYPPMNRKQKPAWSEEDTRLLDNCISLIEDVDCTKEEQNWLKSIKERVQPQPKQEWSDEEIGKLCLDAISLLRDYASGVDKNSQLGRKIGRVDTFLSGLYHNAFYPFAYNMREDLRKVEWSEEDEKEVAILEAYIRSKDWSDSHIDRALGIVDELVKKLKE